jgi:hypothetical protein
MTNAARETGTAPDAGLADEAGGAAVVERSASRCAQRTAMTMRTPAAHEKPRRLRVIRQHLAAQFSVVASVAVVERLLMPHSARVFVDRSACGPPVSSPSNLVVAGERGKNA